MSLMLSAFSTSSGATIVGNTTMSESPSSGSTCGSERLEMRAGPGLGSPALEIVMNSVSAAVGVVLGSGGLLKAGGNGG